MKETKKISILIVEDDTSWQEIYNELLSSTGHVIHFASSFAEAILVLTKTRFDLAIIDVRLDVNDENRDGLRILSQLVKLDVRPQIILATGHKEDVGSAERKYAIGVLDKPFKADQLLSLIAKSVESKDNGEENLAYWELKELFRTIIGKMSREHLDISVILNFILTEVARLIGAPYANLALVQGNELIVSAATAGETGNKYSVEDCVSGLTVRRRQTVYASDVRAEEPYKSLFKPDLRPDTRTELAVPAMIGLEVIAVLNFESPQKGVFKNVDITLIEDLAASAAIAIDNARMQQGLIEQAKRVIQLSDISEEFNSIIREGQEIVAQKVIDKMIDFLKCKKGAIFLVYGKEQPYYSLVAHRGLSESYSEKSKRIDFSSPRAYTVRTGLPIYVNNVESYEDINFLGEPNFVQSIAHNEGFRSFLDQPLQIQRKTIGSLVAYYPEVSHFEDNSEELALAKMFADHAAIALENARQYQELEIAKRNEKLAAIGEISGDLVHRLNSPLIAVKSNIELIERRYGDNLDKYLQEKLHEIKTVVSDAIAKVTKMKEQARSDVINFIAVDIVDLVKRVIEDIGIPNQVELENNLTKQSNLPAVKANKQLAKVIENLINNGIDAMPQGGKIIIDGFEVPPFVEISITDTGVGILDGWEEAIFNVLSVFTSKPARGEAGQGLGLWYSKAYIEACGGEFPLPEKGKDGKGTRFVIRLPIFDNIKEGNENEKNLNSR
jgi:signal transduction histidine kinase/CheY-like chemotaxis protein